jgi:hypothetical protein
MSHKKRMGVGLSEMYYMKDMREIMNRILERSSVMSILFLPKSLLVLFSLVSCFNKLLLSGLRRQYLGNICKYIKLYFKLSTLYSLLLKALIFGKHYKGRKRTKSMLSDITFL